MSDENEKKPDAIEDVRKGLGLLFRAAKTAVSDLPTGKLETAVVSGVKEVGKAIESVAQAVEKEVFGHKKSDKPTQPEGHPNERVRVDTAADPNPTQTVTDTGKSPSSDVPRTSDEVPKEDPK